MQPGTDGAPRLEVEDGAVNPVLRERPEPVGAGERYRDLPEWQPFERDHAEDHDRRDEDQGRNERTATATTSSRESNIGGEARRSSERDSCSTPTS